MWPDTPEDYKTPSGLKLFIALLIFIGSCVIAIPIVILIL